MAQGATNNYIISDYIEYGYLSDRLIRLCDITIKCIERNKHFLIVFFSSFFRHAEITPEDIKSKNQIKIRGELGIHKKTHWEVLSSCCKDCDKLNCYPLVNFFTKFTRVGHNGYANMSVDVSLTKNHARDRTNSNIGLRIILENSHNQVFTSNWISLPFKRHSSPSRIVPKQSKTKTVQHVLSVPPNVWHQHILTYLTFQDKKNLRATSRDFNILLLQLYLYKWDIQYIDMLLFNRPDHWPLNVSYLEHTYDISADIHLDLACMKSFENITFLHISSSCQYTDAMLSYLPSSLMFLTIDDGKYITDCGITFLPFGLKTLYLTNVPHITNESIKNLPPFLLHLILRKNDHINDMALQCLPPSLRSLELYQIPHITDKGVSDLPISLIQLELISCNLYAPDFSAFSELQWLSIQNCGILDPVNLKHAKGTSTYVIEKNCVFRGV